jgi:hypothetical protein
VTRLSGVSGPPSARATPWCAWRCLVDPHSKHAPSLAVTAAERRRHCGVQYGLVRSRFVWQTRERERWASRPQARHGLGPTILRMAVRFRG